MTTQPLRDYQQNAVVSVLKAWESGTRSVCLVAPTGSGKTRLAEEFCYRELAQTGQVLFVAHRRELIKQSAERFRKRFGRLEVGIIAAGQDADPHARIQVASIQTLVARDHLPTASLVIIDEAHHILAEEWVKVANNYSSARLLGLTATPERQDGRSLGDIFSGIVVAANYSELLRDGHLVQCRVYQPPEILGSDLAQDPLTAYQRYAENSRAFVFCSSVEAAYELARRFEESGISAGTIEAKTKHADRDETLRKFSAGELRVITNVFALTEGVDIPSARTVILARGCGHVGAYLQMVGRVLRPHPDKTDAILIDLSGATLVHGLPTEDREYSLEGEGIKRTSLASLKNCPSCGATILSAYQSCPECEFAFKTQPRQCPKIYDFELRAVFAGSETPSDAKQREYSRLRTLQKQRGFDLYFVVKSYKDLFGIEPIIGDATEEEKKTEIEKLKAFAAKRGFKPGFAGVRFKALFGHWPAR